MDLIFQSARWLHIIAGFLALVLFWVPIVSKKGRKLHTRSGWAYTYSMVVVSVSALAMGLYRILWDPLRNQDSIAFAWFLIFISILSGACAWYGLRVLRFKRRSGRHIVISDLAFPSLLLLSGIGITIYGFIINFELLKYFPLFGIFLGLSQLIYWHAQPKLRMHWMIEHITGMLSCCIATLTAFTVFGAPRLLNIDSVNLIVWLLPTLVIVPFIIGFTNHYKRRYN